MKTTTLTLTAFLLASTAQAGIVEDVIADLTDQGYTQIEVKNRLGTVKIEGIKDGQQRELVFNRLTGELVKDETNGLDDDDDALEDDDDGSGKGRGRGRGRGGHDDDGSGHSGSGGSDGGNSGSGGSGGDAGSGGGNSGSGGGGSSGGGSGGGGDSALLQTPGFDYLNGGQARDIDFA